MWGLALAGLLALAPAAAVGQTPPQAWDAQDVQDFPNWSDDDVPAHISFAEGEAWLERENTIDGAPTGVPLLAGDRIRSERGRLEVLFADGTALSLDEFTDVEFLSDDLLRLNRGTLRLDLTRDAGSAGYRIDAAGTTAWLRAAGEYRIEMTGDGTGDPDVRLLVVRGQAELSVNGRRTLVRAGYEAFASATTTPSLPYAVAVTRWDAFDRWWTDRRNLRSGYQSAEYLPSEISYYAGVLDRDGDWRYESSHGYVWYPRVADAWSPYSAGRWTFTGAYGWFWVGADRWSWPTHHYGRWGYSGRRYFWIPGRAWAPAWVAWASSPTYVGWVPLGFDNRPLFSISVAYSSGWRGWSHAPVRSFSAGLVFANRGRYLPPRGTVFSTRFTGPGRPARVPVRQATGLTGPARRVGPATVAVPRALPRPSSTRSVIVGTNQDRGRPPTAGRVQDSPTGATIRRAPAVSERPVVPARNAAQPRGTAAPRAVVPPRATAPASRSIVPSPSSRRLPPPTQDRVQTARPRAVIRQPAPSGPRAIAPGTAFPGTRSPGSVERQRTPAAGPPARTGPAPRVAPAGRPQGSVASPRRVSPSPAPAPPPGRSGAMRAAPPQAPRVDAPRPAPRRAPAESGGGRATARPRD